MNGLICITLSALLACAFGAAAEVVPGTLNVRDFGAKGDGVADDTAAFQKALDEAAAAGGGTVLAPRGNYLFAGHLSVPNAVTLRGLWESVPAHNGIRDKGLPKPTDDGTTFLVTESEGVEDAPPFLTLNTNSTLKGVVIYYPKQQPDAEPNRTLGRSRCAARTRRSSTSSCSTRTTASTPHRTSAT
jgi:hypothetical protein